MKKVVFIFLFFNFTLYSQNANTKFLLDGFLMEKPNKTSTSICEFKKNKNVIVIDFIGNNWWKVKYNSCIGFVVSPYLKMNDDLLRIEEEKWQQWRDEVQKEIDDEKKKQEEIKRADSIKKSEIEAKRIEDEIKIFNLRQINLNKLISDSLIVTTVRSGARLQLEPDILGFTILTFQKTTKIIVLNYSNQYYYVCANTECGYINEIWVVTNEFTKKLVTKRLNKEMDKHLLDLEKKKRLKKEAWAKQEKIYINIYGEKLYNKLKKGYYWLGMTTEMARISLGRPNDINRTVGSWGTHEQWVYNNGIYLYFESGILKSYQN